MKTLNNTDMDLNNTSSVQVHGDPSKWICLCKAWCEPEGWMKSTKVMNCLSGILVQVSTQQGDNVAEALSYVPGVCVEYIDDSRGWEICSR